MKMNKLVPVTTRSIIVIVLGFFLGACTNNLTPVPEAEYSTKIIGSWRGTVGDSKETMSINSDGTFVCNVHSTGFIATTLSQSLPGIISGTWKMTGAVITLSITGAKNEKLENRITSSTIESFKVDELVLKSINGETSLFRRVHIHWYNSNSKR